MQIDRYRGETELEDMYMSSCVYLHDITTCNIVGKRRLNEVKLVKVRKCLLKSYLCSR